MMSTKKKKWNQMQKKIKPIEKNQQEQSVLWVFSLITYLGRTDTESEVLQQTDWFGVESKILDST